MKIKRSGRNLVWFIHLLVWIAIFVMPFLFTHSHDDGPNRREDFRMLDTLTTFLWMGLFYLNALLLMPQLLNRKKYLLYAFVIVLVFTLFMALHAGLYLLIFVNRHFPVIPSVLHNLAPFFFTTIISAAYKIIDDKFTSDAAEAALQKENLKTEVSFLRSQISPHFLFNVLNNIVAMVRLKSDELEPTVIRLSALLQYMLYESSDEKVLLKSEVESLRDFIDLQRLRFNTNLKLENDISVKEEWHSIEPMLLIPFVENAFKHGNTYMEPPEILIRLRVENNILDFAVRNRYVVFDKAKDKISGIGLVNVKRRLALLYPGRHTLEILEENGYYNVHLKLMLK